MTTTESPSTPWDWRLRWFPIEGDHEELVLSRWQAALRCCEIRAEFGDGWPIQIDRRPRGQDGKWESTDWWCLWHGIRGAKRRTLSLRPGFVFPNAPAWLDS